ncbi:MAG: hypothetical protein ACE1ZA_22045, partial [Pseudomonadales bacterium]
MFSTVLTVMILYRGFEVKKGGEDGYAFREIELAGTLPALDWTAADVKLPQIDPYRNWTVLEPEGEWRNEKNARFVRLKEETGRISVWHNQGPTSGKDVLFEAQTVTRTADGNELVNGEPKGTEKGEPELHPIGYLSKLPGGKEKTGPLNPLSFFRTLQDSEVVLWANETIAEPDGSVTTVYYQKPTPGSRVLRPGEHPRFKGIRSDQAIDKLNFLSLMLALFCGTASLPHILIRYYTVKDEASARKSTIVGIATIGFFYVLTLYMGLGAMTSGSLDVTNSNMAAPLLAKSISEWLFAVISAIAFTTVLGTVSGLILASAGAVSHDLVTNVLGVPLTDHQQVRVA